MGEFEKFYNKALKFLSYRPRSEKEIRDKLKRKKASEDIINKIISKLKENNFLNDEEFVKWWIEQRANFKPRSLRLIKMELRQKGIDTELIDSVIQSSEFRIQNDLELAKKLMEKRTKKYKNLPREEKFQKVARYLASKGFNYDIIKEIFKLIE